LDGVEHRLKHLLPFFGDYKAHEVGTDRIKKYISSRQGEGAMNGTINRELAALKRMYSLGMQAEKIYRKPYIPMLQEDNVRRGFFEYGEFLALRKVLPDYLQAVATFAYYTGWRKEKILSLMWNQVDLQALTVRLEVGTAKNKGGRIVSLEGELWEVIQS
jgi:integrase